MDHYRLKLWASIIFLALSIGFAFWVTWPLSPLSMRRDINALELRLERLEKR